MSILKNELPILEFDTDQNAVIMPDHERKKTHMKNLKLPKKAVFAFLGDEIDRYAEENDGVVVSHFISMTKEYTVYVILLGNC